MRRREFITRLAGASLAWPLAALAAGPVRLIGVLMAYSENDLAAQSQLAAFRGALAKQGWTEGGNLRIELRWGNGKPDKIDALANELVKLRPDAILGATTPAVSYTHLDSGPPFCRFCRRHIGVTQTKEGTRMTANPKEVQRLCRFPFSL